MPNNFKEKLNIDEHPWKGVTTAGENGSNRGELKFEKSFTSFHWEYMIKAVPNTMFGDKGVVIVCKHIKVRLLMLFFF